MPFYRLFFCRAPEVAEHEPFLLFIYKKSVLNGLETQLFTFVSCHTLVINSVININAEAPAKYTFIDPNIKTNYRQREEGCLSCYNAIQCVLQVKCES